MKMKKKLVSALTTALVVGTTVSAFAASSPFSDVPADHWAYNAVSELASEGVLAGYPDGAFKGDKLMTRYEMAQAVYQAMGNNGSLSPDGKKNLGRLITEFQEELNRMGLQVNIVVSRLDDLDAKVNKLDKKVEEQGTRIGNVDLKGQIRYDYIRKNSHAGANGLGNSRSQRAQRLMLRLTPSMKLNDQWTGHARMDFSLSTNSGMNSSVGEKSGAYGENYHVLDQVYAEGKYGKTSIKLGRFGTYDQSSHGMILDDNVTGIEITAPIAPKLSVQATAGRYSYDPNRTTNGDGIFMISDKAGGQGSVYSNNTTDYAALDLMYKNNKFGLGLGIKNFRGHDNFHQMEQGDRGLEEWGYTESDGTQHRFSGDTMRVWSIGADYRFNKDWQVVADYGRLIKGGDNMDSAHKTSYSVQVNYKNVDSKKPGSYKLFLAYRQLSHAGTMVPTYQNSL
ncbi:MAG: S-layer homology domain-containing protein, partial [Anaerovibrio sp.]|nr:S-layer homology domain-containing protein [Anaerovibrio sp.]